MPGKILMSGSRPPGAARVPLERVLELALSRLQTKGALQGDKASRMRAAGVLLLRAQ